MIRRRQLGYVAAGAVIITSLCCIGRANEVENPRREWVIVSFSIPGPTTMSHDEARRLVSTRVIHDGDRGSALGVECEGMTQAHRRERSGQFFASYSTSPEMLGYPANPEGQIIVSRFSCNGQPWPGPGGTLLWYGPDRAFSPWKDVWFELRADTSRGAKGVPFPD